ncbi:MAG: DUF3187 family protein [Deltaproteobacteria bacterium]|nr:DUF3187 family protein [Deltaproteobacteria bacterium]
MRVSVHGIVCGALLLPIAAFAWGHPPAPLTYQSQHPFSLQFAQLKPMPVVADAPGDGRWAMTTQYSNIFEQFVTPTENVQIDLEQWQTEMEIAYGLGHQFTLEGTLPITTTWGGFLDGFLQWYHHLFGFPNGGRESVANNTYAVHMIDRTTGATRYAVAAHGPVFGDLSLRLRHALAPETPTRPGIGWFATVQLPTGSRKKGTGNNRLDYGLGLLLEKTGRRWYGFLNVGYFINGGQANLEPFLHNETFAYALGGAYRLSRSVALQAQVHGGTPQLSGIADRQWEDPPLDLVFGVTGYHPAALGEEDFFWEVGFSEDLHPNGPSIDFTAILRAGIAWRGL